MFVPFITARMQRRAGGGGGGGSTGGGSKGGSGSTSKSGSGTGSSSSSGGSKGSSGGSSSGSNGGSSNGKVSSVSAGGTSKAASSYSRGGGSISTIPSGQLFAGRSIGGGTRDQVFGTRTYGSGYPGTSGRGVAGRGFPFYFWPVVWGGAVSAGTAPYLHSDEYGLPDNSSRPGGPMVSVTFNSSAGGSSTFHVVSDNQTVTSLISDITGNCSSLFNTSSSTTNAYNASDPSAPQPEQVIQYYRASSAYLMLDGYNNTAVFESENATDVPLPSWVNTTAIDCLNQTIGAAVPLVDADTPSSSSSSIYSSPTGNLPYSNAAAMITHSLGTLTWSWILLCFAAWL
ncbi:uncharacterized protein EV420DRAFT_1507461 [Desarmillaria tabescens]|uniref:Uncharacterized protein n=1 Tax=Armillaria tabescens TaxID=1929756 RepID=A0AA39TYZ7_ARMTA|nr:uncharacterized protein EV420DRAFT_1507461 [Desarmillaria tabescens]KAK0467144.1 hypothetical protein EV420DRAFT_1507461 [Desarmillaria tabescens]